MMILKTKSVIYNTDGSADKFATEITDGYSTITAELPISKFELSNEELVKNTLEAFYEKYFPKRAENERFNEVDESINKVDQALKHYQEEFEKIKVTSEAMNDALMEIIEKFYNVEEGGE